MASRLRNKTARVSFFAFQDMITTVTGVLMIVMLLLTLELNKAPEILIHVLGITLLIGRTLHALALPAKDLKRRILGMQITIYLIIGLAILNILFFIFTDSLKF